jgi:hypothetical protein
MAISEFSVNLVYLPPVLVYCVKKNLATVGKSGLDNWSRQRKEFPAQFDNSFKKSRMRQEEEERRETERERERAKEM